MLRSIKDLRGFRVQATDGPIGSIDDAYFDDERWAVRYLVVDTGKWIPGRQVLILPFAVSELDWGDQTLHVTVTRDQVRSSPSVDTHRPVSRQQELMHHRYYGMAPYWTGPALWGAAHFPTAPSPAQLAEADRLAQVELDRARAQGDEHLRSAREVTGYTLHASDGDIGHVDDLLVEERSWAVRYLVINTSQWWFGRKVLMPPGWTTAVEWASRAVRTGISREQVKNAPSFDRAGHVDRQWEAEYYKHYGKQPYWDETPPAPPQ